MVVWEYPESIRRSISAGRIGKVESRGGALKMFCTSLYAFNEGPGASCQYERAISCHVYLPIQR
jgi:hypothetical protein